MHIINNEKCPWNHRFENILFKNQEWMEGCKKDTGVQVLKIILEKLGDAVMRGGEEEERALEDLREMIEGDFGLVKTPTGIYVLGSYGIDDE